MKLPAAALPLLLLCPGISTLTTFAAPQPVEIKNASFEEDAASLIPQPGNFTAANVPQWQAAAAGLFRPDMPVNFAPDGAAVVYIDAGGSLSQALTFPGGAAVTATSNAVITVSLQARPRLVAGTCNLAFDARAAGGVSVAAVPGTLTLAANPAAYTAVSKSFSLKDAAGLGAAAGQPLTLVISGTGSQANIDEVEVTVAFPPVINEVTAAPQPAAAGQPVTVSWSVTGADSLTFDGVDVTGLSSKVILAPAAPRTYLLKAVNADGESTRSVPVDVAPAALTLNTGVHISEVMTDNVSGLTDVDGERNDWIEIANDSAAVVNLQGWSLTDDRTMPRKWVFPANLMAPGGRLLVFASGKNRAVAGQELHTGFRLDADGEFLALYDSAGVLRGNFGPRLPALGPDVSYGTGRGAVPGQEVILSAADASVKWMVPSAPVDDAWRGAAGPFDDAAWSNGQWPLGFNQNSVTAYNVPPNTAGVQAYNGALGMDFDVVRPVEVLEAGCFDHQSNGIAAGTTVSVQLWRRSVPPVALDLDPVAAGMQATVTFTAASGGTLSGGCRFKPLSGPVSLPAGSYTIVAFGYGAAEMNGNMSGTTPFPVTADGGSGAITFTGSGRFGPAGSFPATADGGPAARYGAGTFGFRETGGVPFTTNTAAAMLNQNASALTRTPFTVAGGEPVAPVLRVTCDDGFVAWINGTEVARRNAPETPAHNAAATEAGSGTYAFSLAGFPGLIHNGTNILAIQGLNVSAGDADFRLSAELSAQAAGDGQRVFFTTPTPGSDNGSGTLAMRPVINEIHSDPVDSKVKFTEFIEIYNPLPVPVDMSGWSLTGGLSWTIPPGTVIPAFSYLVIAEDPAHLAEHLGYSGALGPWSGGLKNEGDEIVLRDASLAMVDRVNYEHGFPWPTVGDAPGLSMQRVHAGLDSSLGASWRSAPPTPGDRNTTLLSAPPPAIRRVTHLPAAPVPGEPVTVTATVSDPDGVAGVWLEYQTVDPGGYIRTTDAAWTANWTVLPMSDDGTGSDIFTVTIPAEVQQHRRLVRYRMRAWDGGLSDVRVPYPDDESANFAYFCYGGVPAWTGAVRPGVTEAATFSAATMNKVRPWHLLSSATDVQNCQYNPAFNDGEYRFEGTLVIGDRVYDHIHYRVKGQNSTFNTGKNKWKLKFNRGHELEMPDDYGTGTTTVRTLNISSVPAPWAPWNRGLSGLDEAVAFRLSNLAGAPAPFTSYLQLRVIDGATEQNPANQYDGDLWGLYLAFENTDNRFKESHGLPDGNIFRMQVTGEGNHILGSGKGQPAGLSDLNAFLSTTTGYRKGGGSASVAPAVANIQTEAWFRANVNLPEYFNWRSVTEAINQTDRRDQENVVYFRDPADGRWQIFPWDVDLLYENFDRWGPRATQNANNLNQYEQISRALLHPAILTEFQNRARELQDLLLNDDQAWKVVDEFVSIITGETPRIIPNGGAIDAGFVEVERRRWDYNPVNVAPPRGAGPVGNYYRTPYPVGNMGNGPPQPYSRALATADFAGMVKWVKDFIATGAWGGGRLAKMAQGETNPFTLVASVAVPVPATPVITYSGPAGFPLNLLRFGSSAFNSPNGQTFAAMAWRIGEIYDPSVPGFIAGRPWRYEIEGVWLPGELSVFAATTDVPATGLVAGRTYRARVRHKDSAGRWSHWSAPVEFQAGAATGGDLMTNLVISEIMYNPPAPEGSDAEFIELMNTHPSAPLDLTGVQFTEGVTFAFPSGTSLAPGERLVLAGNIASFAAKYGAGIPVAGEFDGNLSNGGERIVLSLGGGTPIRDFTYDNNFPWPAEPDNAGVSLVLTAPHTNPDHANPLNWRASAAPGPGGGDSASYEAWKTTHQQTGDDDDHDRDGLTALMEYALGSDPKAPSPGALPVLQSQPDGSLLLTLDRQLTTDDAAWTVEESADLSAWAAAPSAILSRESGAGREVIRYRLVPDGSRRYVRVKFTLR